MRGSGRGQQMHLGPRNVCERLTDVPPASRSAGCLFLRVRVCVAFIWRVRLKTQRLPWWNANDTGGGAAETRRRRALMKSFLTINYSYFIPVIQYSGESDGADRTCNFQA